MDAVLTRTKDPLCPGISEGMGLNLQEGLEPDMGSLSRTSMAQSPASARRVRA